MRTTKPRHIKKMARSAFADSASRAWAPKSPELKRLAGCWWLGYLLERLNSESIRELQYRLSPHLTHRTGKRKRIKHRHDWAAYTKGRFPKSSTVDHFEGEIEGSSRYAFSPLWALLEAADPLKVWRKRAVPELRPDIAGMWIRFEGADQLNSLDRRNWLRAACRLNTPDALALLAALYLLLRVKGQNRPAAEILRSMIRTLIIEHSRFPIRPWELQLFEVLRQRIWKEPENYWDGYRFNIACAAAIAIRGCHDWKVDLSAPFDSILLPGPEWRQLGSPPDAELARVSVRLRPWDDKLAHLEKALKELMRHGTKPRPVETQEGRPRVGLSWHPNPSTGYRTPGYFRLRDVTVTFVEAVNDPGEWRENIREKQPMRYHVDRGPLGSFASMSPWRKDRPAFVHFPQQARTLHIGPNFQAL